MLKQQLTGRFERTSVRFCSHPEICQAFNHVTLPCLQVYKNKAASTVRGITHTLKEQEEDFAGKAARYQREMKHLHWLLQDRQEAFDEVLQQKR